jgi:uncharacterized protein (TIGR03067 family)
MLRSLTILLLAAPLVLAAPVPKELKRTDEQAILGMWDMVAHSSNGAPATPQTVKWRLESDGKAFILNPGESAIGYKLHPELSPKGFDWQWPGSLHLGRYQLEGDTLKVVITSGASTVRPTELKPAADVIYCEFKRVAGGELERAKPRKPEAGK